MFFNKPKPDPRPTPKYRIAENAAGEFFIETLIRDLGGRGRSLYDHMGPQRFDSLNAARQFLKDYLADQAKEEQNRRIVNTRSLRRCNMSIKLEVGKSYTRADGSVHKIVAMLTGDKHIYQSDIGQTYTEDGMWWLMPDSWDLIAEVPTPFEIVVGGVYRTNVGSKIRVYAVDGIGEYPIHGATEFPTGWHVSVHKREQIIGPWVDKPKVIEAWAVVYTSNRIWSYHHTEAAAQSVLEVVGPEWTVVKLTGTLEVKS